MSIRISLPACLIAAMGSCAMSLASQVRSTARPDAVPRILIRPDSLPKPVDAPVNAGPQMVPRPDGATLSLPAGFKAEVIADKLENPRWLAVAPNGDIFVVESGAGRVVVLHDKAGNANAVPETFAEQLTQPFGILFYKSWVYIANTNSVVRFPYKTGQTKADAPPEVILPDIPGQGYHGHWTRDLAYNPRTGKMYITIGSHVDIGEEEDPRRATICEFNPEGTAFRVYASGLRNAVGIGFQPVTGEMWAAVNERDNMGDRLPPDYVTSVKEGGFYGWPYYYIGANHDARMPEKPALAAKVIVPDVLVEAHSAALGLVFYTGRQFPKEYQGDAFVALHGSSNRAKRTGYKIICVPFKNGKFIGGYEDFLTGWSMGEDDPRVWGRPVGLALAKDGSLLIADDGAGKVWRVSYAR